MNRIKIAAFLAAALAVAPTAAWPSYKVLYSFCAADACADGSVPYAPLAIGASGTLYGTTTTGGAAGAGVVFALKPHRNGNWTQSVLHSFCTADCADGQNPYAGLILDTAGKLYGTTSKHGVAFRLDPATKQFDVLERLGASYAPLSFSGTGFDGHSPLYGTIARGGDYGKGAVFVLRPRTDGTWHRKFAWSFCAGGDKCSDGANPLGGVAISARGHLVGVTEHGGSSGAADGGVIYQIVNGQQKALFPLCPVNFCTTGGYPQYVMPVIKHANADETYVVTTSAPGHGTFLEYHTADNSVVYDGAFFQGANPLAGGVEDPASGNILGTTSRGGNTAIDPNGGGTIFTYFKISRGLNDIYFFCQQANCTDGERPAAALLLDPSTGVYYGTTTKGGAHGKGVVFQFSP